MSESPRSAKKSRRAQASLIRTHRPFILFQQLVPQHRLTRVVGQLAASQNPLVRRAFIQSFAKRYNIDMTKAAQPDLRAYRSFNEFFTRELKADARHVDHDPRAIDSPADGVISQIGRISGDRVFQAKGQSYSARELLGDHPLAHEFEDGQFVTVYLSPRDYHRVHMPYTGWLTETIYVPGQLFSVNDVTAQHVPNLFARNERLVCLFDIDMEGRKSRMAVVMVGAMIVAGIETVATGKIKPTSHIQVERHEMLLQKGQELGRFYLGSTAIVLFQKDQMEWLWPFQAGTDVSYGERLGVTLPR